MTTRMSQSVVAAMALAILVGAPAWWEEAISGGPQQSPPGVFGMVGLSRTQTARLGVVSPGEAVGVHPVPKLLELSFVNGSGETIKMAEVLLHPGQAVFLDLMGEEAIPVGADIGRVEIRALVRMLPSPAQDSSPPGSPGEVCIPTLQIVDTATEATTILYAGTPLVEPGPSRIPPRGTQSSRGLPDR